MSICLVFRQSSLFICKPEINKFLDIMNIRKLGFLLGRTFKTKIDFAIVNCLNFDCQDAFNSFEVHPNLPDFITGL